jgi:small GTP-binding protein
MENTLPDVIIIFLVGHSGGGKKTLLRKYILEEHELNSFTSGIYFRKNIENKEVNIISLDTKCGMMGTKTSYLRIVDILFIVFDLTDEESIRELTNYLINSRYCSNEDLRICLVGNKCDKPSRKILPEHGRLVATKYNVPYFETSALNGIGVKKMFDYMLLYSFFNKKMRNLCSLYNSFQSNLSQTQKKKYFDQEKERKRTAMSIIKRDIVDSKQKIKRIELCIK